MIYTSVSCSSTTFIYFRQGRTGYVSSSNRDLIYPASEFGNATASDVASGKTFTSASGLRVTGTLESIATCECIGSTDMDYEPWDIEYYATECDLYTSKDYKLLIVCVGGMFRGATNEEGHIIVIDFKFIGVCPMIVFTEDEVLRGTSKLVRCYVLDIETGKGKYVNIGIHAKQNGSRILFTPIGDPEVYLLDNGTEAFEVCASICY